MLLVLVIGYRLLVLSQLIAFKPAKQARSNLVVANLRSKQESQRWSTVGDSKKAKDGAILYS
jgi:hypothetical protein